MKLKKNIFANYFGQGWSALMSLAFVPLYIKYLGMEAYGLIGTFAVLQAWLTLLDMGMAPTLGREMARFTGGAHSAQSIHNLLRSLEVLCAVVAVLVCAMVWAISGWLAADWLRVTVLSINSVAQSISIIGIVIALRIVESVYRSGLIGLQRQVWYNTANACLATVRSLGAVALVVWISPSVEAFFLWQASISLLTVFVFARGVHRGLPRPKIPPAFSVQSLSDVGKYAKGMACITLLSLLLTQIDKVLLSRLLSLEEFGVYTLAAAVSGALYMVISPVTSAVYPRLVELASNDETVTLTSTYHKGAQLLTVITAPLTIVLVLFGQGALFAWSGSSSLAHSAGPILSILLLGTFLNGLMFLPYHLQLTYGWTSLSVKINAVAVAVLVPAIIYSVPHFGAIAAAWIWAILNIAYVLIGVQLMHRKLLPNEKSAWYLFDVAAPIMGALVLILSVMYFRPSNYIERWEWLRFLCLTYILGTAGACIASNDIRARIISTFHRLSAGIRSTPNLPG